MKRYLKDFLLLAAILAPVMAQAALSELSTGLKLGNGAFLPTSTTANLPAAAGASGDIYDVTDVGPGGATLQISDGTSWKLANGIAVVSGSGVAVANTGIATTEACMVDVPLPILQANDIIYIYAVWTFSGTSGDTVGGFIRLAGTGCTPGSTTGVTGTSYANKSTTISAMADLQLSANIINVNSASAQKGWPTGSTGNITSTASMASSSIATGTASHIQINSITTTSSADTITLIGYYIYIIRGS